jgi:ribosome maturation factor RimP
LGESGFQRRATGDAAGQRNSAAVGVRLGWHEAIAATVGGLGYELVEVERAQRGLLRVYIDRVPGRVYRGAGGVDDGGEFVTVDDCEQVTRQLQYALEVEGLEYARLEVSSPGLDRPLKREADYLRFVGQAVHVTLKQPFKGRKVWQGVLTRAEGQAEGQANLGGWSLVIKDGKAEQVLGFTLEEVREARLVPVLDFKGRKPKGDDGTGTASASPANDGG